METFAKMWLWQGFALNLMQDEQAILPVKKGK